VWIGLSSSSRFEYHPRRIPLATAGGLHENDSPDSYRGEATMRSSMAANQPNPRPRIHLADSRPLHPGEVLRANYLRPARLSPFRLAQILHVAPRQLREVLRGREPMSAELALRLARYFGTSERYWLDLQADFDLDITRDKLGDRIEREVIVRKPPNRPGEAMRRAELGTAAPRRAAQSRGGVVPTKPRAESSGAAQS
jgi:addiction module HigA family antidote